MRRRKQKRLEEKDATVDMTPMLDNIFILLIFFIVTTSFVKDDGFLVEKVEENRAQAQGKIKTITIHIDANDTIFFNNKPVDIERLPARIEYFIANNQVEKVLVRPHAETNYQKVVTVLDQIAPFKRLQINVGIYQP